MLIHLLDLKLANTAKKQRVATMKLVTVLCLAMIATACCRSRLTQSHLWTDKQFIAAIDQDPARQDTWIQKEIGPDVFLVVEGGKYIKR